MKHTWSVIRALSLTFLVLCCLGQRVLADHLSMSGTINYTLDEFATFQVERIENSSDATTGALKLQLYALIYPYDGGPHEGHLIAERGLGTMQSGAVIDNLDVAGAFTAPPAGVYHIAMVLAEAVGTNFVPQTWFNFSQVRKFGTRIPSPPVITSALNKNGVFNRPLTYRILATNSPVEFRVSTNSLPGGLTYDRFTGLISGVPTNFGTFNVAMSAGNNGGTDERVLRMVIGTKPVITNQPDSVMADAGANVSFLAAATGFPAPRFQWLKDGIKISGATNSTLSLPNVQPNQAGVYQVIASNIAGSTASSNAVLTICNFIFSPNAAFMSRDGGSSNVSIKVAGVCSWNVVNTNSWITLNATNGTGNGSLNYVVGTNPGDATRVGYLKIGSRGFAVVQTGNPVVTNLVGKTISFITNAVSLTNEVSVTNSVLSKALLVSTGNNYRLLDAGGATLESGSIAISRADGATAELSFNGTVSSLSFETSAAGTFLMTNAALEVESGRFTILNTEPDYNGDGLSDILYITGSGWVVADLMNGTNAIGAAWIKKLASGWRVVGTGDINTNGVDDIVFQDGTGRLAAWYINGAQAVGSSLLNGGVGPGSSWRAFSVVDFNGDGKDDILFQHTDRRTMVWYMSGTNRIRQVVLRNGVPAAEGWQAVTTADFNLDGSADILWQNTKGQLAVWHFISGNYIHAITLRNGTSVGFGWKAKAAADFNRNGSADVLWRNDAKRLAYWFFEKESYKGAWLVPLAANPEELLDIVGPK